MSFTVVPEEAARQRADSGPPDDVIRLSPPVLALVKYVMDHWNDLVQCARDPRQLQQCLSSSQ